MLELFCHITFLQFRVVKLILTKFYQQTVLQLVLLNSTLLKGPLKVQVTQVFQIICVKVKKEHILLLLVDKL